MAFYGYEYFSGANVVLEIEGFPVLECAGIALSITESKRPVYGYSSRHFDAVARGQVIVQGSLLINYVHDEYMFRLVEQALIEQDILAGAVVKKPVKDEIKDSLGLPVRNNQLLNELVEDYQGNVAIAEAFKAKYWDRVPDKNEVYNRYVPNLHDSFGGLDIKITYGARNLANNYSGKTGKLVQSVYFTGRSQSIQISEDVIVEEYPFFARNTISYKQSLNLSNPTGEETDIAVERIRRN